MSPASQNFPDTIRRLRDLAQKERDPMDKTEHPKIFELEKDSEGRDIAIPLLTAHEIRAESWNSIALAFDYSAPLHDESRLSPYQHRLRAELSTGRNNALLFGPPSTGKTTVAMWALRDLHLVGRRVKAARFTQFKTQMEPRYLEENGVSPDTVTRWYSEPEFLLLDELGYGDTRQTIREHERRIFFDLISVRDSMDRRTWVCSNTDRAQLHELYGEAALSRLDGMGRCIVADFGGEPNLRYGRK